LSYWFINKS